MEEKLKQKSSEGFLNKVFGKLYILVLTLLIVSLIARFFVVDVYRVTSNSMEDAIMTGSYQFVNKLDYGPRLPMSPLHAFGVTVQMLPYVRIPCGSQVKSGDVVAFNLPVEYNQVIDQREVFVKRCVGAPGDTIQAINGVLQINGVNERFGSTIRRGYEISSDEPITIPNLFLSRIYQPGSQSTGVDAHKYFVEANAEQIDDLLSEDRTIKIRPSTRENLAPFYLNGISPEWTTSDFGPIRVPKKGLQIELNPKNIAVYADVIINHDAHDTLTFSNGAIYLNGSILETYVFTNDYFFAVGDNRPHSKDSRHWGFVPCTHLIGRVLN
ncbi:MAG TPA: signal peptidase I [Chryseosolibacter sp.]